jgi:hypothetical protein
MTTNVNVQCAQLRSKLQNLEVRLKIAQPLPTRPQGSHEMPSAGTDRKASADELQKQIDEVKGELQKAGC